MRDLLELQNVRQIQFSVHQVHPKERGQTFKPTQEVLTCLLGATLKLLLRDGGISEPKLFSD
jgi:hypothetical protein